jgi:hypothetical protein
MNRIALSVLFATVSGFAAAANFNLAVSWTDPTPAGTGYSPTYDIETRIASGTAVRDCGLTTPALTKLVVANTGDKIEVRVRAHNTIGPIDGPWTVWYAANVPTVPSTPLVQTGIAMTVTVQ